jgi:hypothetical protein
MVWHRRRCRRGWRHNPRRLLDERDDEFVDETGDPVAVGAKGHHERVLWDDPPSVDCPIVSPSCPNTRVPFQSNSASPTGYRPYAIGLSGA